MSAAAVASHRGIVTSAQMARFQVRTFCPSSMKKGIMLNAPSQRLMKMAHGRKLMPLMIIPRIPAAESAMEVSPKMPAAAMFTIGPTSEIMPLVFRSIASPM